MARFGVVTLFLRPRGWTQPAAERTAGLVAPRWRIARRSWSPLWQWLTGWTETDATCFLLSAVIHMSIFVVLALIPMRAAPGGGDGPPEFTPPEIAVDERPEVIHINFDDAAQEEPGDLTNRALSHPEEFGSPREFNDSSEEFEAAGGGRKPTTDGAPYDGLGRPDIWGVGIGPLIHGSDGIGRGLGEGDMPGAGGSGFGFGKRGKGSRLGTGGSRQAELAVVAALDWLYRHQAAAGNWSLTQFRARCRNSRACTGPALPFNNNDGAATALGLLPFLAAGQTHKEKCAYQATVNRAITWLVKHQQGDGDLSLRQPQTMYSHGLATIALCEAYAMTKDESLRGPAQAAVNFIEMAENPDIGALRYTPGLQSGDTSVVGWQVMALKSTRWPGWRSIRAGWSWCRNGCGRSPRATTWACSPTSPFASPAPP